MNIWNILGIGPTTDKKTIRKAYAAKTREIHPEDAPEEFKRLHEAYQAALGYADYVRQVSRSALKTEEEGTPDEGAGQENLRAYFEERQEKTRRQVDAFLKLWNAFRSPYHNPESMDWWKNYLASEEFQNIRFHSKVLKVLADEINDKCFYGIDEVKMLFWEAYGFQEGEETAWQGDQQRLWRSLYTAYEKRQQTIECQQKSTRHNQILHIFGNIVLATAFVICILAFVKVHRQRENGRLYLIDYMEKQYPMAGFTKPERIEKKDDGSIVYRLLSAAHPELPVTAEVEYGFVEGKRDYLVKEDYGQQLFEYYAAQYGLEGGLVSYTEGIYAGQTMIEYSALFYSDIREVDAFCERAEKMFREQEELQAISEVAVCTEDVLFPKILLQGGELKIPFADMQVYDLRTVEAEELSEALREAYMCYMFQYEAWNITPEQYREWGAAYEKRSAQWEDDDGEWHEVYDPDTGELLCRLFISTYYKMDGYYDSENITVPIMDRRITVGNAYYFLQDRGANLTVNEDGSGFSVTFYGNITSFGNEPSVKFYDLRHCY